MENFSLRTKPSQLRRTQRVTGGSTLSRAIRSGVAGGVMFSLVGCTNPAPPDIADVPGITFCKDAIGADTAYPEELPALPPAQLKPEENPVCSTNTVNTPNGNQPYLACMALTTDKEMPDGLAFFLLGKPENSDTSYVFAGGRIWAVCSTDPDTDKAINCKYAKIPPTAEKGSILHLASNAMPPADMGLDCGVSVDLASFVGDPNSDVCAIQTGRTLVHRDCTGNQKFIGAGNNGSDLTYVTLE